MKKIAIITALLFSFIFCKAQTEWQSKNLQPKYEVNYTQVSNETFYRTSWAKCMENAHLSCLTTWWCNSAVEVALIPGWAIQYTINPETNWNGTTYFEKRNSNYKTK